ncbi:MAG: hypothetical protein DSY76_05135 [Bacteroidetes bacterium]|nr:MAG: hypothetical protein DSY76_05135 [Bacteroidota bacterium]
MIKLSDKVKVEPCGFLRALLVLAFALLLCLNAYISYEIVLQLKGDGWSFLGGLFIAIVYLATLPATVLSFLSIKKFNKAKRYKFTFPFILSLFGIFLALFLFNAFEYWIALLLLSTLMLIAVLLCNSKVNFATQRNLRNDDVVVTKKTEAVPSIFWIVKMIQLIGFVIILFITVGIFVSKDFTMLHKSIVLSIIVLHAVVSIAFFKRKRWALKVKLYSSYVFLGVIIVVFISFLITDGISLTVSFFATIGTFLVLFFVFTYLLLAYRKLIKLQLS